MCQTQRESWDLPRPLDPHCPNPFNSTLQVEFALSATITDFVALQLCVSVELLIIVTYSIFSLSKWFNILMQGLVGLVVRPAESGCLGAGTGAGSCPAAPFR